MNLVSHQDLSTFPLVLISVVRPKLRCVCEIVVIWFIFTFILNSYASPVGSFDQLYVNFLV